MHSSLCQAAALLVGTGFELPLKLMGDSGDEPAILVFSIL